MFNKTMKIFAIVMSLVILLAACDTTVPPTSDLDVSEVPDVSGENDEPESKELQSEFVESTTATVEHKVINDTSENVVPETNIEGKYVALSKTLQEEITAFSSPTKIKDLEDGSIVMVFIENLSNPIKMHAFKFNPETGKLLEKATYEFEGYYAYSQLNKDDTLPGDLFISADKAFYSFDFNDLSKKPLEIKLPQSFIEAMGNYTMFDDTSQMDFSLTHERVNINPKDGSVVYVAQDGLYLMRPGESAPEKIAEQPEEAIWVPEVEESDYAESTFYNQKMKTQYSKPRFSPDGTKVFVDVKSFVLPGEKAAVSVFDIETKELLQTFKFFDPQSDLAKGNEDIWKNGKGIWFVSTDMADENTFVMIVSGYYEGSTKRYDAFYDINANEISSTHVSDTGITSNYELIAINDTNKGSSQNILFYALKKGGKVIYDDIIKLDDAQSVSLGITETKTLVRIFGTAKFEGSVCYIVIDNPSVE